MIDRSNLTKREIQELPTILRICFYIQGWNHSANIETLNDWLEFFWGLFEINKGRFAEYQGLSREDVKKESQKIMLDKVDELARFLRDIYFTVEDKMEIDFFLTSTGKDVYLGKMKLEEENDWRKK